MVVGNPRYDEESTKIPNNTWKIAKEPNKPSQERTRSKLQVKMDIAMESHFLQRKKTKKKKQKKEKSESSSTIQSSIAYKPFSAALRVTLILPERDPYRHISTANRSLTLL